MPDPNAAIDPMDNPGVASAELGQVILDGPDGVAITLTPKAAVATAASLLKAAEEAIAQTAT